MQPKQWDRYNELPLPRKFNGKMEHWEDWSWSVKSYIAAVKTEAARVMDNCETVATPIIDEELRELKLVSRNLLMLVWLNSI